MPVPPRPPQLVLASASPARLGLLRAAGFAPQVRVSGVDEDALLAALGPDAAADEVVRSLAVAKARAVAGDGERDEVVVGCDSMLLLEGTRAGGLLGKPADAAEAVARWHAMRGREGRLLTGHCVVRGEREAAGVAATTVRFGEPTDAEVEAYVATGEPLHVAGAFTLDGRSAPFVRGVDGDHGNVIGLSLPLLRDLLGEVGVGVPELWS